MEVLYHHGAVEERMWNEDRTPREIIHSDSFRIRNLRLIFSVQLTQMNEKGTTLDLMLRIRNACKTLVGKL